MASDSIVVTKEVPLFTKKKHELSKILKKISAVTEDAVEVLAKGLEDADPKVRISCAKELINYEIAMTKQINDDMMQRQIAEIKLNGGATKNLTTEEKARTPIVNFNEIIDV